MGSVLGQAAGMGSVLAPVAGRDWVQAAGVGKRWVPAAAGAAGIPSDEAQTVQAAVAAAAPASTLHQGPHLENISKYCANTLLMASKC